MMTNNFNFAPDEASLEALVREGLRDGGQWCDLYFENTEYSELLLRDSVVSSGGCHTDCGCGIRVLCGEKTGYAYSQTLDMASLLAAARSAGSIAVCPSAASPSLNVSAAPRRNIPEISPERYGMQRDWRDQKASLMVPALERIETEIRRRESRTEKVIAMLSSSVSEVLMYNSLGELTRDCRPLGSISVTVIFRNGKAVEQKSVSRSLRTGAELLSEEVLLDIARRATTGVDEMFEASRPKGGKMSVVMGAGASGILLHEAMGHAFEADFNRKGQSIFSDAMGTRICRPGINIVDDGTLPSSRGSINYDDEGVPSQKTYMVTDGVLTSYLHDRISAAFYGVAPTGNGRRESFRYNPIPRMRTTYMESGADGTREDLIGSVHKGIYVDEFANGQVKIGEGDFTFYVKSGFLIEGGRLTRPIKDINIIGNGPRALADIRAVAGDLKVDEGTWTCGKEQSVAVSCGIPTVLIDNLTVGGQ